MKKYQTFMLVVISLVLILGACTDPGLDKRVSSLEAEVRTVRVQNRALAAEVNTLETQVKILKKQNSHFAIAITDHETDFHMLYKKLGWGEYSDAFANWSDNPEFWETLWGCTTSPCGFTGFSLRTYGE